RLEPPRERAPLRAAADRGADGKRAPSRRPGLRRGRGARVRPAPLRPVHAERALTRSDGQRRRSRPRDRRLVRRGGRRTAHLRAREAERRPLHVRAAELGGGQVDDEDRAARLAAFDPDLALHLADELPADVQAEPGAADATRQLRVEAVELLEDPLPLARWDADPLVADAGTDAVVDTLHRDLDPPTVPRVLDRVCEEVAAHAPQLFPAGGNAASAVRRQDDLDSAPRMGKPLGLDHAGCDLLRIALLDLELLEAGVEPACEEDGADDPGQPVRLLDDH